MDQNVNTDLIRSITDAELDTVTGGEANAFVEGFDSFFVRLLGVQDGHGKGPIHHMTDSGAHY